MSTLAVSPLSASDPLFRSLIRGSAPAPGPVAPAAGFKSYAAQGVQLDKNVNDFLIASAYASVAAAGPAAGWYGLGLNFNALI